MKDLLKKSVFWVMGLAASGLSSAAQTNPNNINRDSLAGVLNTITTAVPFLMISPDARAGGMGDLGVATSPDVSSIHWNPAKLAFIEKDAGFAVSYTPWLRSLVNDIYLANLAGYKKLGSDQAIAMSLTYF